MRYFEEMEDTLKRIIRDEIRAKPEELERDPLGNSVYLFFLLRNRIESPEVDNLVDWMNMWINTILNEEKFSRFLDREFTSAVLGYHSLRMFHKLGVGIDINKLNQTLSKHMTNGYYFGNITYSILILLSLAEFRNMIYAFDEVLIQIKGDLESGIIFNNGRNLVFLAILLRRLDMQEELRSLVKTCFDRIVKNEVQFDDVIYYAWVLWNYREFLEERKRSTIKEFISKTLENTFSMLKEEMVNELVKEMYGKDVRAHSSKILVGTFLDLLIDFSKHTMEIVNYTYIRRALSSFGWGDICRELERALTAFEDERMSDCCHNLRTAFLTCWIKVCEKLSGRSLPLEKGKTPDIKLLIKCLKEHGFADDIIGLITRTWSYLSERVHIEKRGGEEPTEQEVRLGIQLTFAVIEYLLRSLKAR